MPADIRKGMPDPKLDRAAFERRFLARFADPAFDSVLLHLRRAAGIAWEAYDEGRKAPVTRRAGIHAGELGWAAVRKRRRSALASRAGRRGARAGRGLRGAPLPLSLARPRQNRYARPSS